MKEGTFDKYDKEYKQALNLAADCVIPNQAYLGMDAFNNSIDYYMDLPWWGKIFLPHPNSNFDSFFKISE